MANRTQNVKANPFNSLCSSLSNDAFWRSNSREKSELQNFINKCQAIKPIGRIISGHLAEKGLNSKTVASTDSFGHTQIDRMCHKTKIDWSYLNSPAKTNKLYGLARQMKLTPEETFELIDSNNPLSLVNRFITSNGLQWSDLLKIIKFLGWINNENETLNHS